MVRLPRIWISSGECRLYIVVEVGKVTFEEVTLAVIPFFIPLIVVLLMITYIPDLVLWLPNLVMGVE